MRKTSVMKYIVGVALMLAVLWVARVYAFPWITDMFYQANIQPYELPAGRTKHLPLPANSIPVGDVTAGMTRQDFAVMKVNPVPASAASLARGETLFKTHCFPCHGMEGLGDGPVIKKGFYPVNLTSPVTKARTDGFIYSYIRFGGLVMMPSYREFIEPDEAWDIVNYVRKLQGGPSKAANSIEKSRVKTADSFHEGAK